MIVNISHSSISDPTNAVNVSTQSIAGGCGSMHLSNDILSENIKTDFQYQDFIFLR